MVKKTIIPVLAIVWISCLTITVASAQNATDGLKAKLKDLRENKAKMIMEYDDEMSKLNKEAEDKLGVIKTEYRLSREALLQDRDGKMKQLRESFQGRIKPLLKEENQLISNIGPSAYSDFVKTKAERERK